MSLENQVALVTGASRGIGQAIALALGQAGAYVIGTATSDAGAEGIRSALRDAGVQGDGRVLDVSDTASMTALAEALAAEDRSPAILVNNAGITRDALLMRMKPEEWDQVIDTNLTSAFHMARLFMKPMIKQRSGRIINVASVVASMGNAGQTNYAAAKAGLIGFTKSLARELAPRGITVNAVAPGFIDTDMTRDLPEKHREALLANVPAGRLGAPDEVAQTVAFLASPGAGYITGETLHVNGGLYMA